MDQQIIKKQSHREWRKEAKKLRRKKIRQKSAKEQFDKESEKLKNPTYLTYLAEQRALELFKLQDEEEQQQEGNEKWLRAELISQKNFRELRRKLDEIEAGKEREREKIKQEYDKEQQRLKDIKEEKIRLAEEAKRKHGELLNKIQIYINHDGDLPEEMKIPAETNPGKPICPFFIKTGSCRFGDRCSRNHSRPGISRLLLVPNFFTNIQLDHTKPSEYGADASLEYDDSDMNKDFAEFFNDVVPEFESFGKLEQFQVSRNYEPHLRGNVYVEFNDQRNALKAYQQMQGRFYAGRQINVEFCSIISWATAVCGLALAKKCLKDRTCNFLHVFKNPKNRFPFDRKRISSLRCFRDEPGNRSKVHNSERVERNWNDEDVGSTKRNWRWSESPEIEPRKSRDRSSSHRSSHREDSRDRNEKRSSSKRKDRERSKSPRNKRSRSDREKRENSRSRSRSDRRNKETSRSRNRSFQNSKDKSYKHKSNK